MRALAATVLFCLLFATGVAADDPSPLASGPTLNAWQVDIIVGISRIAGSKALVKNNEGAEIGIVTRLPWRLWVEERNLIAVRAQLTGYSSGIELPTANAAGEPNKLVNASHSQVRIDWRQIFPLWGIHWSAGLGVQIPVVSGILTPRGEYSFSEAKSLYPEAAADLGRIDRSTGIFVRLGVDQKLLDDALVLGAALEIMTIEVPRTEQRFALSLYAGARIW